MTVYHISTVAGYRRPLPSDVGPVPENMASLHYGYRWHPFRRMMYDHLHHFFPDAHILEAVDHHPSYHDSFYSRIARIKISIIVSEIVWKSDGMNFRPQPRVELVEKGATYDLNLWEIPLWVPHTLSRQSFTHLTQSFPDDIMIPQLRRYR